MVVDQFVMAYQVEQDRLRALLPDGYESLRPVLRINAEIRNTEAGEEVYLEYNTPVAAFGKRGWLNIANWTTPKEEIAWERRGKAITFKSPVVEITYTGTGVQGGCPAEQDNDGCFFLSPEVRFVPRETIASFKEFCDCSFEWKFADGNAKGISIGEKTKHVTLTAVKTVYKKELFSAEAAAKIPCEQILGAYTVRFERLNEV